MTVSEKISGEVSRRALLTGGLAGGFLLAFHLPVRAVNEPVQPPDVTDGKFAPNAFIRIDNAGKTTLVMPQVEMGQGVYTAVAMILAEELDADFAQLTLEHAPPNDKLYGQPHFRSSGHRQFQFDPGVLETVARGRCRRARHAGAGRRAGMAGRAGKLHDSERRGHA
jgi:CO/xanthine dehydrogenase Mo-binding subunit